MKNCPKCNQVKPPEDFGKHSSRPDGLQGCCKICKAKYRLDNIEKYNETHKAYLARNLEKIKAKVFEYRKLYREKHNANNRKYAKTARVTKNSNLAKYRAAKDNRTPSWLSKEQLKQIEQFYWLANDLRKVTGEVYHVDHIVPLRGKNVSGLHVPWNLQILPMDLNCSKSNMMEQMQIAAENGL